MATAPSLGASATALPPPPPPKDLQHQHQRSHATPLHSSATAANTSNSTSKYIDSQLAAAVRDSVHITPSGGPSRPIDHQTKQNGVTTAAPSTASTTAPGLLPPIDAPQPRRSPSPHMPSGPQGRTPTSFALGHGYSQSSPDMSSVTQPQMPSAAMPAQNPFEQDEVEPMGSGRVRPPGGGALPRSQLGMDAGGVVPPARQKFSRAMTGNNTTSSSQANLLGPASPGGTKNRVRRSMSSDSYGFQRDDPTAREIMAGQKKAAEDKKGSRHADLIDRWDPTGLGNASSSGPYDAAAPSRNTNLPPTKAPMQAFQVPAVTSPPKERQTSISLAAPPALPTKDAEAAAVLRRSQAKPSAAGRLTSGGLTGQYSTSMPSSGGYFPDPSEMLDEAALARKERQKERESKRRALKAAWGIDDPEPFEDFGGFPAESGMVDITEDELSPDGGAGLPAAKPMRSPGLRLGGGPRTPPIKEGSLSPTNENAPGLSRSGPMTSTGSAFPGGVKRTKSIMQKIKTMVRTRSGSVESADMPIVRPGLSEGHRSHSMNAGFGAARPMLSPGVILDSDVLEVEEMVEGEDDMGDQNEREDVFGAGERENPNTFLRSSSPGKYSPTTESPTVPLSGPLTSTSIVEEHENPFASPPKQDSRRPGLLTRTSGRASPQKPYGAGQGDGIEDMDLNMPNLSPGESEFVLVDSPSSKARAMRALQEERAARAAREDRLATRQYDEQLPPAPAQGRLPPFAANRVKTLPLPPVGQVMPDFDDIVPQRKMSGSGLEREKGEALEPAVGVRRKTSMVKKLKDKMGK